ERGHGKPGQPATDGQAAGDGDGLSTAVDLFVGDQVYVDRSRVGGGGHAYPGGEDLRDAAAAAGAQDELGGVDRPGEVQQRGRNIGTDDLVVGAAEALDQDPLPGQVGRVAAGQTVVTRHMHGEQVGALGAGGDAGGPPD